jgi:hypothetical protein
LPGRPAATVRLHPGGYCEEPGRPAPGSVLTCHQLKAPAGLPSGAHPQHGQDSRPAARHQQPGPAGFRLVVDQQPAPAVARVVRLPRSRLARMRHQHFLADPGPVPMTVPWHRQKAPKPTGWSAACPQASWLRIAQLHCLLSAPQQNDTAMCKSLIHNMPL